MYVSGISAEEIYDTLRKCLAALRSTIQSDGLPTVGAGLSDAAIGGTVAGSVAVGGICALAVYFERRTGAISTKAAAVRDVVADAAAKFAVSCTVQWQKTKERLANFFCCRKPEPPAEQIELQYMAAAMRGANEERQALENRLAEVLVDGTENTEPGRAVNLPLLAAVRFRICLVKVFRVEK